MEICEQNEIWESIEGATDLSYLHTKIILKEGDNYYYAISTRRRHTFSKVDIPELNLVPIAVSQIWPPFSAQFTRAPEPLPQNCYVKRPSLIAYYKPKDLAELGSRMLHEAGICEILKASPHPNVAQYLGCVVENDKVTGLCFVKYSMDLKQRVTKDSRPFDAGLLFQGIQAGIQHLHSLGIIHCDISTTNIMMDGDTPVIIDFDCSQHNGEKLGFKSGTLDSENKDSDFKFAGTEDDEYELSRIRAFLFKDRKT